jgi:ATP-dependent DNA helicase RecG
LFNVVIEIHDEILLREHIQKAERLVERLAENQQKMLILIRIHSTISKREFSKTLGISITAIDKNLTLKRKGFLKRVGPDKGGHWEVIGK